MHILTMVLTLIVSTLSWASTSGENARMPPVNAKLRPATAQWILFTTELHKDKQYLRIARSGSKWICETDLRPYFVSQRNPLEAFDGLRAKKFQSCQQNRTTVVDNRFGKKTESVLCWEDPKVREVMQALRKDCTPPPI